jgi:hypothetical protein
MRHLRLAVASTMLAVGLAACSDSTSPEELAGTYDVTVMEFTNADDTSEKVDVVDLGAVIEVTITAAGAFTLDVDGVPETGTITIDGDNVTITLEGDPSTGTIDQNGDTVTINLATGVSYDFDDDGTDEDATLRIVMTRQA